MNSPNTFFWQPCPGINVPHWPLKQGFSVDQQNIFRDLDPQLCDSKTWRGWLEAAWTAGASCGFLRNPPAPKALFFDMDATLIAEESLDELAELAGIKPQIAAITAQAMAGHLDFAAALTQRVALLAGMDFAKVELIGQNLRFQPGAEQLVATARAHGCKVFIATGGFHAMADVVAQRLKVDANHVWANRFEVDSENKLTGRLKGPLVDAEAKGEFVIKMTERYEISTDRAVALGDGANDRFMMQTVGTSVGFRPKPTLYPHVRAVIGPNHGHEILIPLLWQS